MPRPVLQVIAASTRPGRKGIGIAHWVTAQARAHGGFEVELVDLAEVGLPLLDEPNHPRLRQYTHEHTRAWSATISRADAFVFVFPEYNYSFSAALKNALDYLFHEWNHKGVGLVSYGGVSAGTRAGAALQPVLTALRLVPVASGATIPFVAQFIDDAGAFSGNAELEAGAAAMFDGLVQVTAVLQPLREASSR